MRQFAQHASVEVALVYGLGDLKGKDSKDKAAHLAKHDGKITAQVRVCVRGGGGSHRALL